MNKRKEYKAWCDYIRSLGLETHRGNWSFARSQWDLYWAGVRDQRLSDVTFYLIDKFGF